MLLEELSNACRRLGRSPGFVVLAAFTLAVGIGVNSAMFTLLDAVLLRPPAHVADPEQVVRMQFQRLDGGDGPAATTTDHPTFEQIRESRAFADVAGWVNVNATLGAGADADVVRASLVSRNFFRLLGTHAHIGALFRPTADALRSGQPAVLSHGFWQRRFGGLASVVGSDLTIDGQIYTVVGVLPNTFPSLDAQQADVWLPLEHASLAGSLP